MSVLKISTASALARVQQERAKIVAEMEKEKQAIADRKAANDRLTKQLHSILLGSDFFQPSDITDFDINRYGDEENSVNISFAASGAAYAAIKAVVDERASLSRTGKAGRHPRYFDPSWQQHRIAEMDKLIELLEITVSPAVSVNISKTLKNLFC